MVFLIVGKNAFFIIQTDKSNNIKLQRHTLYLTVCFYHITYAFRVNLHSVITWMLRNSSLETGTKSEI